MPPLLQRARAYLAAMTPAVAGSGGHHATFSAALVLVRGFALPEAEAAALLAEWNQTHATPPWTAADLRRKLRDAARSPLPCGYLLNENDSGNGSDPARRARHAPSYETDTEARARHRREWPPFHPLKPPGIRAVAALRRLPAASIQLAARSGLLAGAHIDGHPSFILHEGTFAQARRLDGQPYTRHDGTPLKAKNLRGAQGAVLGRTTLATTPPVLLVEGCIGWLEALAALLITDHLDWTALAAVSASARLSSDPALLRQLAGRRVRIVPDNDAHGQGLRAASIWAAELRHAGAIVDAFHLPPGTKDLGDLVTAPAHHAATLQDLFTL